jgi:hypothetical protein
MKKDERLHKLFLELDFLIEELIDCYPAVYSGADRMSQILNLQLHTLTSTPQVSDRCHIWAPGRGTYEESYEVVEFLREHLKHKGPQVDSRLLTINITVCPEGRFTLWIPVDSITSISESHILFGSIPTDRTHQLSEFFKEKLLEWVFRVFPDEKERYEKEKIETVVKGPTGTHPPL